MFNTSLVFPMAALVLLNFSVMSLLLYSRIRAVRQRQVSPRYFRVNRGDVPEQLERIEQNYANLLELPLLFYIACILATVLHQVSDAFVSLAWVYVLFRVFHSVIHISYNNILHRLAAFAISDIILLVMWIVIVVQVS